MKQDFFHNTIIIGWILKKLLIIFIFLPFVANADESILRLYNYHFNEFLEVSNLHTDALKINHIFRSPDGKEHPISPALLSLLIKIRDHFKADTIEIISGYRSPEYNKSLKSAGKNVAFESLHMHGFAVDIHIDEITEETLWKYVKKLKVGGSGLYPDYNFVHIDLGSKRSWEEAQGERKITSEGEPVFITDKNVYILKNPPYPPFFKGGKGGILFIPLLPEDAVFERFIRGKWQKEEASPMLFGKYRAVSSAGKSNEFYIKRK